MRPIPVRGALCAAGHCRCPARRFERRLARRGRRRFGRYPVPAPLFRGGPRNCAGGRRACASAARLAAELAAEVTYGTELVFLPPAEAGLPFTPLKVGRFPFPQPYYEPPALRLFAEAVARSLAGLPD